MTTRIFTAENNDGTIVVIHAAPGFTRDSFTAYVMSVMRDVDSFYLDLYEWDDDETFARWMMGEECVPFVSWPRMAENARYGSIQWCYPGELRFLLPNQKPPQPRGLAGVPVPGDGYNPDAYDLDDPKHPTYHDRMSNVYDLRAGK